MKRLPIACYTDPNAHNTPWPGDFEDSETYIAESIGLWGLGSVESTVGRRPSAFYAIRIIMRKPRT